MSDSPLTTAHRLLVEAIDALSAATDGATDDDLLSVLTLCGGTSRRLDRLTVATVASLERRGTFAERGYTSTPAALGDLLGWERFEARHRVVAAEQVCPRVSLDGTALPAKLPATAAVFAAGHTGLRHVAVIARVLAGPAAQRRRRPSTPPPNCKPGVPLWWRPLTRTGPSLMTGRPPWSTNCTWCVTVGRRAAR
ncbi:DUF222 domain-containing protein [Pseudonocardia xinjiangensis]|uniref:DUF222 domain-containing protein n=1 Tax=Pseudonocardia xinjiangensis TaxID=75289 RepID=UPI001B7D195E|nr:DUF222 domain-containing protein [Pseudonocardia xinjiangensis]